MEWFLLPFVLQLNGSLRFNFKQIQNLNNHYFQIVQNAFYLPWYFRILWNISCIQLIATNHAAGESLAMVSVVPYFYLCSVGCFFSFWRIVRSSCLRVLSCNSGEGIHHCLISRCYVKNSVSQNTEGFFLMEL